MAVTWGGAELRLLEATLIPGFVAMVVRPPSSASNHPTVRGPAPLPFLSSLTEPTRFPDRDFTGALQIHFSPTGLHVNLTWS